MYNCCHIWYICRTQWYFILGVVTWTHSPLRIRLSDFSHSFTLYHIFYVQGPAARRRELMLAACLFSCCSPLPIGLAALWAYHLSNHYCCFINCLPTNNCLSPNKLLLGFTWFIILNRNTSQMSTTWTSTNSNKTQQLLNSPVVLSGTAIYSYPGQ